MTTNSQEAILSLLKFYSRLNRSLTAVEIWRGINANGNLNETLSELDSLVRNGDISQKDGFFSITKPESDFSPRLNQDFLLDVKWKKLFVHARLFRHAPFVEFALASGSMALGNVERTSDFDMLVGMRCGRMFIGRYFLLALFSLFGIRRSDDKKESSPDKFCFNHFVAESAYSKPPNNAYRRELYRNLIPICGKKEALEKFFNQNSIVAENNGAIPNTWREIGTTQSTFKSMLEWALGGTFGDWVEKISTRIAKKRLGKYTENRGSDGRVVVSDSELEFHFSLPYEK